MFWGKFRIVALSVCLVIFATPRITAVGEADELVCHKKGDDCVSRNEFLKAAEAQKGTYKNNVLS